MSIKNLLCQLMQCGQLSGTAVSHLQGREPRSFSVKEAQCLDSSSLALKTWRVPREAREKLASAIGEGVSSSN